MFECQHSLTIPGQAGTVFLELCIHTVVIFATMMNDIGAHITDSMTERVLYGTKLSRQIMFGLQIVLKIKPVKLICRKPLIHESFMPQKFSTIQYHLQGALPTQHSETVMHFTHFIFLECIIE